MGSWRENIESAIEYMKMFLIEKPKVGIIYLEKADKLQELLSKSKSIRFKDVPHFPTKEGPEKLGNFICGYMGTKYTIIMECCYHYHANNTREQRAARIRLMRKFGVETVIIIGTGSGLNGDYAVGDYVLVADHVCLTTIMSTFVNPNQKSESGPLVEKEIYNHRMNKEIKSMAKNMNFNGRIHEGRYTLINESTYVTPAEIGMLKVTGADAIGTDVSHEAVAARDLGMDVVAMLVIVDKDGSYLQDPENENVKQVVRIAQQNLALLLHHFVLKQ